MAEVEKTSLADLVNDFLVSTSHTDEDCMLVFTLYSMLMSTAQENAELEMENSMLEREVGIAEETIERLKKAAEEPKYTA